MAEIVKLHIIDGPQPLGLAVVNPRANLRLTIQAGGGGDVPWYSGATEVTPSRDTQTLHTAGLRMPDNVVVNPIPSDWGHIVYSGFWLRVE